MRRADRKRPDAAGPSFRRRSGHAFAAALAFVAAAGLTGCGGGHKQNQQAKVVAKTFVCRADSYVRANHPHTNYGNTQAIFVDGSPVVRGYVSFDQSGPRSTISRATVRLYSLSTSSEGIQLRATTSGWSEGGITYENAPPVGRLVSLSGALQTDHWVSLDVTSYVRRNAGSIPLVLVAIGPTALTLASRSDQEHAPRLVVEYGR